MDLKFNENILWLNNFLIHVFLKKKVSEKIFDTPFEPFDEPFFQTPALKKEQENKVHNNFKYPLYV